MTLFNNICRQHDDAIEKQLVTRQLNIKTNESKSWFTILKKTLIKYDFSNINELVAKPPKKSIWKSLIITNCGKLGPLSVPLGCDGFFLKYDCIIITELQDRETRENERF